MPTPAVIAQSTDIQDVRRWALEWATTASDRLTKLVQAQNQVTSLNNRVANQEKEIRRLLNHLDKLVDKIEDLEAIIRKVKELTNPNGSDPSPASRRG